MPFTIVAFIWRKPGLSPSEFRSHYENQHIPLLLSLTGPTFPLSHTRFYLVKNSLDSTSSTGVSTVDYSPTVFAASPDDFGYDVYCELVFEDSAAFEAFFSRMQDPRTAAAIADDESKFIDRQKMEVAAVQEPVVTKRPLA